MASLVIHILIFLFATTNFSQTKEQEKKQAQETEVRNESPIVELIEAGDKGKEQVTERYYWGIGIYSHEMLTSVGMNMKLVLRVDKVIAGYCAEANGVLVGDAIVAVNGEEYPLVDIKSDTPGVLTLTILRESGIITKTFARCKVYY